MEQRRLTDQLENLSDHDLLVAHSVKIDNICKMIRENNNKLDTYIDKIDHRCETTHDRIDVQIDNTISKGTIKWGVGIIFVVFVSIISVIGVNQVLISKHTAEIKDTKEHIIIVETKLEQNRAFLKSNYKSLIHIQETMEQK